MHTHLQEYLSTSEFGHQHFSKPPSRWAGFVQLIKTKSKRHIGTLHPLNLSRRFSSSMRKHASKSPTESDLNYFKPHWKNITLSQLQSATNILLTKDFEPQVHLSVFFSRAYSFFQSGISVDVESSYRRTRDDMLISLADITDFEKRPDELGDGEKM
ncbi:hypothetical protein AgCh_032936 [Apium graveolens]